MIVLGISLTACMQSALLHHVPTRNACLRTLIADFPSSHTPQFKLDVACLLVINLRRIYISLGFGKYAPLANQTSKVYRLPYCKFSPLFTPDRITQVAYWFIYLFLLLGGRGGSRLGRCLDGSDRQSLAKEGIARVDGIQNTGQERTQAGTDPVYDVVRRLGWEDLSHCASSEIKGSYVR